MEDMREHPNPQGLDELVSAGLGQGRLVEAGDLFKMQIEKATGFRVVTNTHLADGNRLFVHVITHAYEKVAHFNLELFPGNHDIVVSTGAFVAENRRGVGIGWQMLKMRMAVAKKVGFQVMLATVEKKNEKEQQLLTRSLWTKANNPEIFTTTADFFYKKL
jgi:hypothetical protein